MKKILILLVFSLLLCSSVFAQKYIGLDKVKQIKLLESTREDVQKIFAGSKLEIHNYDEWFDLKNSRIEISYSAGACSKRNFYEWNVPEWKVTEVTILLEGKVKLKDTGFNVSKYKVKRVSDVRNGKVYTNDEKGIKLVVTEGDVETIEFYPQKKYQHLSCDK